MDKKPAGTTFFRKYRDSILFNRNLIISGICGFFASAFISQIYSQFDHNGLANSGVALITEYATYIPLFTLLFYIDNRKKYVDASTGKRNTKQIKEDIRKLFAAFSISEIVFSITRILTQFQLLQSGTIQPYEASMISSLAAWTIFFVAINVMAKLVKLFQKF